jgi:hypothetical protein
MLNTSARLRSIMQGLWRRCRRKARKQWRLLGLAGVCVLMLATAMLCVTAYLERWGESKKRTNQLPANGSNPSAPATAVPQFFADKAVPPVFQQYSDAHNRATASPGLGRYLIYEIPAEGTLPHSLLGLTSTFMLALMTGRALLVQWTAHYEAPGPSDIGGGAGNYVLSSSSNTNATAVDDSTSTSMDRRSSLPEIFLDPGFWWGWDR